MEPEAVEVGRSTTETFGNYRAEWMSDELFRLFTRPAYYPELETARPCVLIGGRGTGKTTALKCLSYDGRHALLNYQDQGIEKWPYYGFYHRVNTNRVTAFRGEELTPEKWTKVFAHYWNLVMCSQVLGFLQWYRERTGRTVELSADACLDIAESLFIGEASTDADLFRALKRGQRRFESFLNNLDADDVPPLSLQGQAVDELCRELLAMEEFKGKHLFFIIDEFENLLDDQQVVINTLMKHCGSDYTFKIGVKETGWRRKSTLNESEQLVSPADYARIDIEERLEGEQFVKFAQEVCTLRSKVSKFPAGVDLDRVLPSLTIEQEARLLGLTEQAASIRARIAGEAVDWPEVATMPDLELYFVDFWSRSQGTSAEEVLADRRRSPAAWSTRFDNYAYTLLFTLKGSRVGIRKYYAGWRTYASMAHSNIRYLLELIDRALTLHEQDGGSSGGPVGPELQTLAATQIGRKNLRELEGLSVHGAQLTKLLLGLGRIFEVLASRPEGHAPEVNQFSLVEDAPLKRAEPLLTAAVMHLALVRSVANKRGSEMEVKGHDYAVHPIFAAFFVFSHRRKRKLKLTPAQLLALVDDHRVAIRQVLRQHNRFEDEYPLPEQLQLFEGYYGASAQ